MKRRRTRGRTSTFARAAVTAALVVPLLAVTACGDPAPAAKATPLPVRIGAIYNLTGDQSVLDSPSLDGARLAVERINAHGGLLGRRVELLERDGQTSEANVRRAAASLVASGVSAIVGLSDTEQVLAAAPIAARAGVPFVTSGATSPRLAEEVPDWLFLACFGDNTQAAASAQYASDRLERAPPPCSTTRTWTIPVCWPSTSPGPSARRAGACWSRPTSRKPPTPWSV